jgi:serine/threonine-protein kinase RIO1
VRSRIEALRQSNRTPLPLLLNETATPRTMRTLKHHSDAILNDELLDPALKTQLLPLLRGAQIQALEGAEAIDELKQSTVAAAASRTRSLQRRSTLQRGGVLTAAHARSMVQNRADAEVEKQRRRVDRADAAVLKQRCTTVLHAVRPGGLLPEWKERRAKVIPIWCDIMDELLRRRQLS